MKKRRRRNPGGLTDAIGTPKQIFESGLAGLASAEATRQLPQLVLGANNTSWQGYLANGVVAVGMTAAAGAFLGPTAARAAFVGGLVILTDRILTEQVSPIGQYLSLSGVGDATAMTKMGTIRDGFFAHPGINNLDGSLWVPDPFTNAAVQAVAAKYPGITQPQAAAIVAQSGGPAATMQKLGAMNPSELHGDFRQAATQFSSRYQGRFNQ